MSDEEAAAANTLVAHARKAIRPVGLFSVSFAIFKCNLNENSHLFALSSSPR